VFGFHERLRKGKKSSKDEPEGKTVKHTKNPAHAARAMHLRGFKVPLQKIGVAPDKALENKAFSLK
jgi:hypothetical protein